MRIGKRKVAFVLLLSLVGLTPSLYSQSKRNVIATNPVYLAFNVVNVVYERVLGSEKGVSFSLAGNAFGAGEISGTKFEVFILSATYKRYTGSNPPKGGWIGVGLAYGIGDYWEVDGSDFADNSAGIAVGGGIGHRFLIKAFTLTPFLWYQVPFPIGALTTQGDVDQPFFGGLMIGIELGLAWSW